MANLNKAVVIGRVGNKPELITKGSRVSTTFLVGTSMVYSNGEAQVDWVSVKATGKQARILCDHLNKGDLCCIEGKYSSGIDSVIAEKVTFLSSSKRQS